DAIGKSVAFFWMPQVVVDDGRDSVEVTAYRSMRDLDRSPAGKYVESAPALSLDHVHPLNTVPPQADAWPVAHAGKPGVVKREAGGLEQGPELVGKKSDPQDGNSHRGTAVQVIQCCGGNRVELEVQHGN